MKQFNRVISLLLMVVLLVGMLPVIHANAAEDASGITGNCNWVYNDATKTLTISPRPDTDGATASYTNPDAAAVKVAAYKVVVVEDEADVLEGEDNWLQDNLVSVILFGVAGVMLILIIILLFVKTDNKTLADVDESIAKGKKEKKSKKSKKDDKDENQAE